MLWLWIVSGVEASSPPVIRGDVSSSTPDLLPLDGVEESPAPVPSPRGVRGGLLPLPEPVSVDTLPVAQFAPAKTAVRWDWPVVGVLSSLYGPRWGRVHEGLDIAAAVGTPVGASAPGVVLRCGERGGYGLAVELLHADGSRSLYAHLSAVHVSKGDVRDAGEPLGLVGQTGHTTGPHLHFELHDPNGQVVDPAQVLP